MSKGRNGRDALEAEAVRHDEEFERRAVEDDPAEFVRHRQPPKDPSQVYSVRLPVSAVEALRQVAEQRQMTPSQLMRAWVLEQLEAERTGAELRVSREDLARVVRTEVEAAFRGHSDAA